MPLSYVSAPRETSRCRHTLNISAVRLVSAVPRPLRTPSEAGQSPRAISVLVLVSHRLWHDTCPGFPFHLPAVTLFFELGIVSSSWCLCVHFRCATTNIRFLPHRTSRQLRLDLAPRTRLEEMILNSVDDALRMTPVRRLAIVLRWLKDTSRPIHSVQPHKCEVQSCPNLVFQRFGVDANVSDCVVLGQK